MVDSASSGSANLTRFPQLQSCVDVTFWSELGERKLNKYKLAEVPVAVAGWFGPSRYAQLPGQLQLDSSSFTDDDVASTSQHGPGTLPVHRRQRKCGMHVVPGSVIIFNTIDAFKAVDKQGLLRQAAAQVWHDIKSGAAEADPTLLSRFSLITFADLKTFRFTYWFLFPVLKPHAPFTCQAAESLEVAVGKEEAAQVCLACDTWRGLGQSDGPAAAVDAAPPPPHVWLLVRSSTGWADVKAVPLSSWADVQGSTLDTFDETLGSPASSKVMLAISDISNLDGHPGWPLRNVLLLAAVRWRVKTLQVLCCRDQRGRTDPVRSQVITMNLSKVPTDWHQDESDVPDSVGWEPGLDGRLEARHIDLSAHMSPHHLAEQAVDLNLHLMRWRAVPDLSTHEIAMTKCLLLGAGTLGCAVARTLLAWGVRHITFVDSSQVAFSNPVRQWLYNFEDSVGGGKPKAQAAADALKRIFPSVQNEGKALTIPMPGHPPRSPTEQETFRQSAQELDAMVQGHDVVFLLTDTRESRWLPSLLAAAHNKLAITSAVGFDSFLVMRHGAGPDQPTAHASCPRLGCYFCNDVVAPLNSTRDRTLDQQCTVARPGLAPIASATSVELMVTLLQHPLRLSAPAPSSARISGGPQPEGVLGVVPHMVRGQLSGFQQTLMEGAAFSQCTACSSQVVDQYKVQGWDFVLKALQDPKSLEDLTGLTQLHQDAMDLLCEGSEEDEEEGVLGSGAAHTPVPPAVPGKGAGVGEGQAEAAAQASNDEEGDEWTTL